MRKTPWSVLFVLSLLFLSGCASSQVEQEVIKIGVTLTLTDFGASWGENIQKGLELAVKEVNAERGINGRPLEIMYEDVGALDLKAAVSAAHKFTSVDNVDIILTQWAEDNEVVWPVATENNIVVINIASGARHIPLSSPYVFMIRQTDEAQASALVHYALSQGITNPVMLAEQTAYIESLSELTNELWNKNTGQDIKKISVTVKEKDYRSVLTKVKEGAHDAIFVYVSSSSFVKMNYDE